MKNVSWKYLELAHKKTGLSYYAIGKEIGATSQRINHAKIGQTELNDDQLFKLAQIAHVPANKIIGEVHIKKAKGEAERGFWEMVASSKELADKASRYILCKIQDFPKLTKTPAFITI